MGAHALQYISLGMTTNTASLALIKSLHCQVNLLWQCMLVEQKEKAKKKAFAFHDPLRIYYCFLCTSL